MTMLFPISASVALGTADRFACTAAENGYLYRALFTNASGTAVTTAARLTVELDTGGGN